MAEAAHEQNHRSIEAEILRLHAARTLLVGETNARKVGRPGTRMVRRKHIVVTRPRGVPGRTGPPGRRPGWLTIFRTPLSHRRWRRVGVLLLRHGRWLGHHGRYFIHLAHPFCRRAGDERAADRNLIQLSQMYTGLAAACVGLRDYYARSGPRSEVGASAFLDLSPFFSASSTCHRTGSPSLADVPARSALYENRKNASTNS
jgi:hypothetical protein